MKISNHATVLMLTTGVASTLFSCQKKEKSQEQPNIIFIMSDDHAYQAISAYGHGLNKTPNIDRIAEEGMLFNQSFVSNSISAPSRAVLLTGKHSHLNGVIDNGVPFDSTQQTFPKILQKNGYQTAMIGKWHLKTQPTGFDYWNILPGQGDYYNPDLIEMGVRKNHTGYVTDIITDIALKWLDTKRDPSKPFVMLYHHKAPHRNWMPGPDHLTMYDGDSFPVPETFFDDYSNRSAAAKEQCMMVARDMHECWDLMLCKEVDTTGEDIEWMDRAWYWKYKMLNKKQREAWNAAYEPKNKAFREANLKGRALAIWKYQRYIKNYLRCIASVDDNIGRVLNYLEKNGLDKNTIIVYTSDQGFYLGEHGWFDKRFMYKESFRTPLIIKWPGVTKGNNNDDFVQNIDFAETFLDMAGTDIPPDMQGKSLVPLLKGNTPDDWRKQLYYHYYEYGGHCVKAHYGIRTKKYKLIHYYFDIDAWELFDMEKDPHELHNVYDDPNYADVVKKLKTELQALRTNYKNTDELDEKYLKKYKK